MAASAAMPADPFFAAAVRPYLVQQLPALPGALLRALAPADAPLDSLAALYRATSPFVSGLAFSLALAPVFLAASTATGHYALVDRAWSVVPALCQANFWAWALLRGLPTGRLGLATLAVLAWSARLTHNFWRKGGYSAGAEDYRWAVVRNQIPSKFLLFLFNALFVSTWQTVVLFLVTAPGYVVSIASTSRPQIETADWAFFATLLGILTFEGVADEQQWRYQQAKKKYLPGIGKSGNGEKAEGKPTGGFAAADLRRGFPTHGLWAYSRHPNAAAEQAFWIVFYLWSAIMTCKLSAAAAQQPQGPVDLRGLVNWSLVGTGLYLLPFNESTKLTERISASKYEQYAEYQRQVGCFLPRLGIFSGGGRWKGPNTGTKKTG